MRFLPIKFSVPFCKRYVYVGLRSARDNKIAVQGVLTYLCTMRCFGCGNFRDLRALSLEDILRAMPMALTAHLALLLDVQFHRRIAHALVGGIDTTPYQYWYTDWVPLADIWPSPLAVEKETETVYGSQLAAHKYLGHG